MAQPCGKMQSIELGFYLDRGACCVHVFLEGTGLLRISQKRRVGLCANCAREARGGCAARLDRARAPRELMARVSSGVWASEDPPPRFNAPPVDRTRSDRSDASPFLFASPHPTPTPPCP